MNKFTYTSESVTDELTIVDFNNGTKLYLIGTAHVSENSAKLVEEIINEIKPSVVCIELDQQRYEAMTAKNRYENIDIFQIIKKRQLFFYIGQFIMASYQKRISEKTGTRPGEEFIRAINLCREKNIELRLIDRNIGITLKRAWRLTPLSHKLKFLGALLTEKGDELENIDIEDLKKKDAIDEMVKAFSNDLPVTKKILIDERDEYLTMGIQRFAEDRTVVIVGAGHVPGIMKGLHEPVDDKRVRELDFIPPPSFISRIIPWIIPLIVAALFLWGFTSGRKDIAGEIALFWILANGLLTAAGCIIAAAHPLTIAAGFFAAPLTSLNPTIGAGFVTAIVQAVAVKPRIADFEQLNSKTMKIMEWWKNRVTRIFLVFILSSIGSSIGTFVALPALRKFFY